MEVGIRISDWSLISSPGPSPLTNLKYKTETCPTSIDEKRKRTYTLVQSEEPLGKELAITGSCQLWEKGSNPWLLPLLSWIL